MHIEENRMFTLEEYEKLQHKYKYNIEFINGDVVLHSKTSVKHNEIVNNIQFKLMSYLTNSKCKVYTEQIELKFHNDKDIINIFPDVFVMCEDGKKVGESFVSPPKIIFEVVSPNYSGHDYITKLQIYQRYGVLEYVIVEQTGEMIQYNLVDGVFKPSINEYYSSNIFEGLFIKTEEILE
ncbi:hypothetical protein CBE01nite_33000 [Clostridium beijerinckii]|jgi:Uncharacterized protein conserved in cyanobacteria|uniref:Uma2 family endonuclease n=1 Tax=Clostridium beijerinckii TaxID=1520 RepID=A0AB74VJ65_CLOBE|nr:Uma2 family endonuclease [Clostridium beijerinckii]NRZ25610.1 Uma2 family endonuclease [Clostridium beijerinckii]NYB98125.1 Uma2 family endonuclease [Clostridium beijerinckii]OOM23260.1 hypothetical protein CLBEI_27810 [Clostridium beijerinckii]QUN36360.1 Uma2 family endonuclease [Clostridium beijerinckii]SQB12928.1 Uncharacterized protein conserved in cyanobacteria [Clostridium beijerinckii]